VERAGPPQIDIPDADGCRRDPLDTVGHVEGGAPGEGQQQNAVGIDAVDNEMSHAMSKGLGLARPRTGNHQQGLRIESGPFLHAVLDGAPLLRIQVSQVVMQHGLGSTWTSATFADSPGAVITLTKRRRCSSVAETPGKPARALVDTAPALDERVQGLGMRFGLRIPQTA
jgi:hypothetical protein